MGPGGDRSGEEADLGQEDYLDAQLKAVHDKFVAKGYPVVVGEYGAIDKPSFDSANNRYRADFAHAIVARAWKYGAATVYWDNGANGKYGFGLFDRRSCAVTHQNIIDAIMSGLNGWRRRSTSGFFPGVGPRREACRKRLPFLP